MPLGQPPLPANAILTIGDWIKTGEADWETPQRESSFITPADMLGRIERHVNSLSAFDRRFARYFTMTHLYNAGETTEALHGYRRTLSKLVNSLSWGREVIPHSPLIQRKLSSTLIFATTNGRLGAIGGCRLKGNREGAIMYIRQNCIVVISLIVIVLTPSQAISEQFTQWNLPEGAKARLGKGLISAISYSPDGEQLAVASSIGVWIYDAQTDEALTLLTGQKAWVTGVVFSPDGRKLASHGNLDNSFYVWDIQTHRLLHTLAHDKVHNSIMSVVFSPDGQMLASCGSLDDTINLWDTETGSRIGSLNHNPRNLVFSPDGEILISQSGDKIIFWEVKTQTAFRTLAVPNSDDLHRLAVSPDGKLLASAIRKRPGENSHESFIYLWDVDTGELQRTIDVRAFFRSGWLSHLIFSPNGERLLASSFNSGIRVFNVNTGQLVDTFWAGESSGVALGISGWAFTPDGETLALASYAGYVELWDAKTFRLLRATNITRHANICNSVAFSPDGKTIASGHDDARVRLWDADTGDFRREFIGHGSNVVSVAFSPTGKKLASGSYDRTIRLWEYDKVLISFGGFGGGAVINTGHKRVLNAIAFSPDGKMLASGSNDGTTRLWDVNTGAHLHTFPIMGSGGVHSVSFSPDGEILASGYLVGAIRLWDVNTGRLIHSLKRGDYLFGGRSIAFSPNGKTIASTFEHDMGEWDRDDWPPPVGDGIYLWDVDTGKLLRTIRIWDTQSIAIHPNGKTIVSGDYPGSVHFYDMETGEHLHTYKEVHKGGVVTSLAFTPDGETLASSGYDGTVLLWDIPRFSASQPDPAAPFMPDKSFAEDTFQDGVMPEDTFQDGVINIQDLIYVSSRFGKARAGEFRADVNSDGVVNIMDMVLVANAMKNRESNVAAQEISFKNDIQPILAERCAIPGCHAAPGVAGLDLTQYDTFKKGGSTGPGFVAGDGKGSLVVKRIDGGGMPPIPPPLTTDQILLFIHWINQGAANN
ncbi:MAG: hypothetical protein OXD49_09885 [Candidatus Poribacteria bacterium]|nr:hypothetical protein [Candidatus Poribacteria bacterium]